MAALSEGEWPAGFRFKPKDRELVDYLYTMVQGVVPSHTTDDIYGEREWRKRFETSADEDTYYFFSRLKLMRENGSRISRVAVDGFWRNQRRSYIDDYDGTTIGSKGLFSFIPNADSSERRGTWVMHEYRLEGRYRDNLYANNLDPNQYVLCRIRKKRRNGRSAADANGRPADYGRPDGDYGSSAADANGRPADYGRPDGDYGSSAADANGRPVDYGRPDGDYMIQCFENWFPDLPLSQV